MTTTTDAPANGFEKTKASDLALLYGITPERARQLVSAVSACRLAEFELMEPPPNPGASLEQLLHAKVIVQALNREEQRRPAGGTPRTIAAVPDDRLIAAAYACWHYPHAGELADVVVRTEGPALLSWSAEAVWRERIDDDAEGGAS